MSRQHAHKVAVIGGGYAGMAAAVTLAQQGVSVTVFESAKQLGGRGRGVSYNGTQLDNGQHLLLGCYRETLRLIEQVGGDIERDFLRLPLQLDLHQHFYLSAPPLPAPLHLLAALLCARGLSFSSRLQAAGFMYSMRRQQFKLSGDDMTVVELLKRYKQSDEAIEKLWEPLCIAALNTPQHKASAQIFLNVLRDALNGARNASDMLLPRMDLTELFPRRAARFVEQRGGAVLTACGVEGLLARDQKIEVHNAQGSQLFDQVICAASPVATARLLRSHATLSDTADQIEALAHQPIYSVYLQYPASVHLPRAMLGFHRQFSQWLFDKGKIARQPGLLVAVISAEGIHQNLDQSALVQNVVAELKRALGFSEKPLWVKVIAEKRATFSCAPGLQRPDMSTAWLGLWLAGDYVAGDYPATLEGAVLSGIQSAEAALARR